MEAPLTEALSDQGRAERNARNKARGGLLGLVLSPILIGAVFFPDYYQGKQCPLSTFRHWSLASANDEFLFGFLGGTIALMMLCSFLVMRHTEGKHYRIAIGSSLLGFLAGAAAYADSINYYYCTTPTNIVMRSGILHAPQLLSWDDVTDVYGWCWISTGRGQAGQHGGSLRLTLNNGGDIRIWLASGNQILFNDYKIVREALKNKTYRYHKDGTVNPDMCPGPLYPLLRDWDVGH